MKKHVVFLCAFAALTLCVSCADKEDDAYYGSISGVVTDFVTNEPVSGAHVMISPSGGTRTTGNNGHYEFVNLEPGPVYTVTVQKDGYKTNRANITVSVGANTEANISLTADEG